MRRGDDYNRGLYRKFTVQRTDGKSAPGQKHADCRYFVLDVDHDQYAPSALKAYAEASREMFPRLAGDIENLLDGQNPFTGAEYREVALSWQERCTSAESELAEKDAKIARLERIEAAAKEMAAQLVEILPSSFTVVDPRMKYMELQINREEFQQAQSALNGYMDALAAYRKATEEKA